MPIPRYDDLFVSILDYLKDGSERKPRELEIPLADQHKLSEEDISKLYESGNGPIFFDRIAWSLSYLRMAGLVEKPKRGIYKITEKGIEILSTPEKLKNYVKTKSSERDKKKAKKKPAELETNGDSDLTPQEKLYESYENIRQSAYDDILDTIISKSAKEFEHLVVSLLERMGYGGEVKNAGKVTQYTNDGGIDGVIKEDVLGLGRIHIQAKRYNRNNTVGREEIQKFVGALAVAQSNKGVFITTSTYSKGAIDYAASLHGSTTLVLIDGLKIAQYIYDYSLGMQTEQVIEIKKMDSDFWDAMQDN
ncbi:MAG TPA: restriction endonuclease [Candidatus Handelsmanbacteria bacterium]|nr:restriction endonuclease [Candidatus Handelsmanbacteria bacterium]